MPAPNPGALANTRSTLPQPLRTVVIIDHANMRITGYESFLRPDPENTLHRRSAYLNPVALADATVATRNMVRNRHVATDDRPARIERIEVFLGRPDPEHQEVAAAITGEQVRLWSQDERVKVVQRDLKYDRRLDGTLRVREKGVDTDAVLAAYRASLDPDVDMVLVLTHDCDIYPVVEMIAAEGRTRVETAGWSVMTATAPRDAEGDRIWRTFLSAEVYGRASDRTDYFHDLGMDKVVERIQRERDEAAALAALAEHDDTDDADDGGEE